MKYLTPKNILAAASSVFATVLLAIVLTIYSGMQQAREEIATVFAQRDAEAHLAQATGAKGFAGASFLGEQHISQIDRLVELAYVVPTPIAAGHCANVDNLTIPTWANGELAAYWGDVIFNYDSIDSGMNCDGGTCSSFLTSILPADLHGGQLCVMGGGTCAGTDGGGIDTKLLSFPSGNQTAFGGTEQLVWSASTSQVQLQVCCGTQSCRAQGRISGQRLRQPAPVDSGADAADAADASDSGSILSVVSTRSHPSAWLGALGGDNVQVNGTGFVSGGSLAVSCNGHAFTSVSFVNSTTLTAVSASQTGVSSPTTQFACTVTNGNGATIGPVSNAVTYNWDPTQDTTIVQAWRSDTNASVSSWSPIVNAQGCGALVQATSGNQCSLGVDTANGMPVFSCPGGSNTKDMTSGTCTTLSAPYGFMVIGKFTGSYIAGHEYAMVSAQSAEPDMEAYQPTGTVPGLYVTGTFGTALSSPQSAMTSLFVAEGLYSTSGTFITGFLNGSSVATGGSAASAAITSIRAFNPAPSDGFNWQGDVAEIWVRNVSTSASAAEITYRDAFWGLAF